MAKTRKPVELQPKSVQSKNAFDQATRLYNAVREANALALNAFACSPQETGDSAKAVSDALIAAEHTALVYLSAAYRDCYEPA